MFVADASSLLTILDGRDGSITRQWQVTGPRSARDRDSRSQPAACGGAPTRGTVVRLDLSTGDLLDAVTVNAERRWDNADQQRNGLYVTTDGVWIPTRNDDDDYEFHRLPLTLGQP